MHDNFALRIAQDLPQSIVQVKFLRGKIKPSCLCLPGIQLLLKRYSFHLCSKGIIAKKCGRTWCSSRCGPSTGPCCVSRPHIHRSLLLPSVHYPYSLYLVFWHCFSRR